MSTQRREFVSLAALATVAGAALLCQSAGFAEAADAKAAAMPDLSGIWWHPSLPGPEPLASGPTGLKNRIRRKEDGASDYNTLAGDYNNPILKPATAAAVKKFGDMAKAGIENPNPANQC